MLKNCDRRREKTSIRRRAKEEKFDTTYTRNYRTSWLHWKPEQCRTLQGTKKVAKIRIHLIFIFSKRRTISFLIWKETSLANNFDVAEIVSGCSQPSHHACPGLCPPSSFRHPREKSNVLTNPIRRHRQRGERPLLQRLRLRQRKSRAHDESGHGNPIQIVGNAQQRLGTRNGRLRNEIRQRFARHHVHRIVEHGKRSRHVDRTRRAPFAKRRQVGDRHDLFAVYGPKDGPGEGQL